MVTLLELLQFSIHASSERIRLLKADAFKTEMRKGMRYFSPQGEPARCVNLKEEYLAGYRWRPVEVEIVVDWISPRHPHWPEYLAAKADVSLWLTALHLLKLGGASPPAKKELRKALRAGQLAHHTSKTRASAFVFHAYACLLSAHAELQQPGDPGRFAEATRFAETRRTERAARAARAEIGSALAQDASHAQ